MKTPDLQEEFINALSDKVPKKVDLENRIADALRIEKDAAYRRLSGKVNFSIREMGILANEFDLSIDRLLRNKDMDYLWIPFMLESPVRRRSMDSLCDVMDLILDRLAIMTLEPSKAGSVCNSLPTEFYVYFPMLAKFMFFKWGHYFVGTEEFNDFSNWEFPERLANVREKVEAASGFQKSFYIWDSSLVWGLASEIQTFYKMYIITEEEKNIIKEELKALLLTLERFLGGAFVPDIHMVPDTDFYVSTISPGFTSSYYASEKMYSVSFNTPFSFAVIDDCYDSFKKIKDWIDSLKNVSTVLSKSGRIERRLFFESQYKTIDQILG